MTPKEKAKYLINEANTIIGSAQFKKESKEIALLCVEQVINTYDLEGYDEEDSKMEYWKQVKHEISLLQLTRDITSK